MHIIKPDSPLGAAQKSVITVGNFDGVHVGHRVLLETLITRAKERNARSIVLTFEPHTRSYFIPQTVFHYLTTLDEKAILLKKYGIDTLACIHFNQEIAEMSPEEFVQKILIRRFGAVEWIMGKNHTFGKNKSGDHNFLQNIGGKNHFSMISVDLHADESSTVSSTRIRTLLSASHVDKAVEMLGHPYVILAERIRGKKKGTELGYPTLNFRCPPSHKVIPPPGVYAAAVEYGSYKLCGALYFGNCPTFGDRDYHFEFYSLDPIETDPKLQEKVALWLYNFIRYDTTFTTVDLLVEQIKKDINSVIQFFQKE